MTERHIQTGLSALPVVTLFSIRVIAKRFPSWGNVLGDILPLGRPQIALSADGRYYWRRLGLPGSRGEHLPLNPNYAPPQDDPTYGVLGETDQRRL